MKSSYCAVGVVGLAVAGLWYAAGGTRPAPAKAADAARVTDPVSHANLSVYFVLGPDAAEILAVGRIVIDADVGPVDLFDHPGDCVRFTTSSHT